MREVSPSFAAAPNNQSVSVSNADLLDPNIAIERDLIQRILDGSREFFYRLIRPHERSVFLAVLSILGNEADAEEVAQETFLKAFTNLAGFRQESKFRTWLIQIATNEARMRLRKDHRQLYESLDEGRPRTEDGDYIPTEFADWREIPSDALERSELREALNNALKSLHEKYRSVLILRDVQQLSITETATILGISEENVKTRTSRARLQMRDLLGPAWARIERGRSQNEGRRTKPATVPNSVNISLVPTYRASAV